MSMTPDKQAVSVDTTATACLVILTMQGYQDKHTTASVQLYLSAGETRALAAVLTDHADLVERRRVHSAGARPGYSGGKTTTLEFGQL
jgi:hypothetical protein